MRPSVLLVKTSSLGDIIANFPVVADILRWHPDAAIDWVVEEDYAELVRLHPHVRHVIVVAQRRWRKVPLSAESRAERRDFVDRLRARRYDFVIDTQGLLKSAIIARRALGPRVGYSWSSAREPPATLTYHRRFAVSRSLHAGGAQPTARRSGARLCHRCAGRFRARARPGSPVGRAAGLLDRCAWHEPR